ncbi:LysR family transcriptional regulator [Actinobacillus equuli subsp. haemolyticus]|nr:LysR family transcriptional regulator [Actinobacillus equuli subsp. haemolyticus]
METVKALLILGKVLDAGNMSQVARELGISSSAVSQHIRQLEKHYGIRVLNRTTRKISPTEAGQILWQGAKEIEHALVTSQQNLTALQTDFKGKVRMSLPSGFIESKEIQHFIQRLEQTYPQIELILLTDDSIADLMDGSIDIAIRAAEPAPNSQLIVRYLTQWRLCLCASPAYLAENPIRTPTDLLAQKWLKYNDSVFNNAFSNLNLGQFRSSKILHCPTILAARTLAISGFGLTFQLEGEIASAIKKEELEIVLPHIQMPYYNLYAVTAHRKQSAKMECVLKLLKESF